MTMSDDAVECAAKGIYRHLMPPPFPIWAELDDATRAKYRPIARAALEAAAPHLLSGAWDGDDEAWDSNRVAIGANPFRSEK